MTEEARALLAWQAPLAACGARWRRVLCTNACHQCFSYLSCLPRTACSTVRAPPKGCRFRGLGSRQAGSSAHFEREKRSHEALFTVKCIVTSGGVGAVHCRYAPDGFTGNQDARGVPTTAPPFDRVLADYTSTGGAPLAGAHYLGCPGPTTCTQQGVQWDAGSSFPTGCVGHVVGVGSTIQPRLLASSGLLAAPCSLRAAGVHLSVSSL